MKSLFRRQEILLAAISCCFCSVLFAAEENPDLFYRAIETTEGLPDNSVTSLAQAPDGYLWIGTEGGLVRSNGTSFTEISLQRFSKVRNRAVRSLMFDYHGQLWVGVEGGPTIRLGRNGGKVFGAADDVFDQTAISIVEDKRGAVWIAYADGLCRVKEEVVSRFTQKEGLPEGGDFQLTRDGLGNVWFAKGGKFGRVLESGIETSNDFGTKHLCIGGSRGGGAWICVGAEIIMFENGELSDTLVVIPGEAEVEEMFEDAAGTLWIGTAGNGLFRIVDGKVEEVATSSANVSCLGNDAEGNLWVGTDGGGLNLIRERAISLLDTKNGLPFQEVRSVCEGAPGELWAVGRNGGLATRSDDVWELVKMPGGKVNCVSADANGGIWVGTREQGLWVLRDGVWLEEEASAKREVRGLLNATDGIVWAASGEADGLLRFKNGIAERVEGPEGCGNVIAMAEDAGGTIWAGTTGGVVLKFDGTMLVEEPAIAQESPLSVRALECTADGSLWIGYAGDGIGRYKGGKYFRITSEYGLRDDYVSQILADEAGALWIAGNLGVFKVEVNELNAVADDTAKRVHSRVFGVNEGMPGLQPQRGAFPLAWRMRSGDLLLSMRNGLVIARPQRVSENPRPPEILIEGVTMDDEPVALYGNRETLRRISKGNILDLSVPEPLLRVPPDYRKLKFQFAALSFASPRNVYFRYRLKGFDRDWVDAEKERTASYPRLPAGKYEFQVIASNNVGVWNDTGKILALEVAPFFWETWWFRIGAVLAGTLAAGSIVFMFQRRRYRRKLQRLAAKRAVEEERARIARDIHDDLGSNLTRIMLLSQPGKSDGEKILPQIHTTSKNLIRAMAEVVWAVNPAQDSLDGLADYLSGYAQDFLGAAGIRCRLDMPVELPGWAISAQKRHGLLLAFKEALNNVAKHSGAGEVLVSLQAQDRGFAISIADDGKGMDAENGARENQHIGGYGMTSMTERLRGIGGECEIKGGSDGGTVVTFCIRTA